MNCDQNYAIYTRIEALLNIVRDFVNIHEDLKNQYQNESLIINIPMFQLRDYSQVEKNCKSHLERAGSKGLG